MAEITEDTRVKMDLLDGSDTEENEIDPENEEEDTPAFVDEDDGKPDLTKLHCRFYEQQFPEIEELVVVNVRHIAEMGAYVTLLEYNNIEGMILLSELSRRRIRSINKLIRVNRNEVVMVLRVDKEKGYIDLSKRRVSPEDVAKCEDRYNKAKAVHSVLRHVADQQGAALEDLYRRCGWPLYRRAGHAYDAFKLALTQDGVFEGLEMSEAEKTELTAYIRRKLAPQPIKVRADVEVTCFAYEGVEAVRAALAAGQAVEAEEGGGGGGGGGGPPVKIRLIAPPMYVLTCSTLDKDLGIALLTKAIEAVRETIVGFNGTLEVKMAPKAVSQREETELQAMMDRLALESEDVDGDGPEDEH
mmetsp:Transcript_44664/g.77293  ORF Transcript_44664/g.77293 Transcript_44664/m.77293 type:complete len:358 (+) Transcript_44664:78-1151(+)